MSDIPSRWQLLVIGAGPAGLAAAIAAAVLGVSVLLIERSETAGGILNQCIHDGFGSIRYGEQLCGPEYAHREIKRLEETTVKTFFNTTITEIVPCEGYYRIEAVSPENGAILVEVESIVLATGCRERSARQIFLQGDRPSGVFTAGLAQYIINCMGYLPGKNCVILGSGDIGLIMARRLTLEGAYVKGVFEIESEPSGLARNIVQCLNDFGIPLHLSRTVTELHGRHRLEAVTVMNVDEKNNLIPGTEHKIDCDTLIVSVGLIPEHDMVNHLGIEFDSNTSGPIVDQNYMSSVPGIFCCGNALHVNDLVDYVTESGEIAGSAAAEYLKREVVHRTLYVTTGEKIRSVVPQHITMRETQKLRIPFFIRSNRTMKQSDIIISHNGSELYRKSFRSIKPPEMIRLMCEIDSSLIKDSIPLKIIIEEKKI